MASLLALLTTLLGVAFALTVARDFWRRRRPHQLVWAFGLLLYAVAAGCLFHAETVGWSPLTYRLYYLTGAYLTAAFLGMGTVYLLARRRLAHGIAAVLALGSLVAGAVVLSVPLDLGALPERARFSGEALPQWVRLGTIPFNVFGTVALAGGALVSAWSCWRRHAPPRRVVSNVLIAAGAGVTASGGTLLKLGVPDAFVWSLFAGLLVIFAGFLVSREVLVLRQARHPGLPLQRSAG
ncbi:MAG TPA: hypothetical protein VIN09_10135 [Chloroflexota bacterium]